MGFWLVAGSIAAAVAALMALALLRGGKAREPAAAYDLQVYRDQMAEVDRDLARGVLSEDAAERARVEVGRRILAADRALKASEGGADAPRWATGAAVAGVAAAVAVAFALYVDLGAPGYPDLPLADRHTAAQAAREARPTQEEAEAALPATVPTDAKLAELAVRLRAVLDERGDEPQGLTMLARSEAQLGDFAGARDAQQRLVALKGTTATTEDLLFLTDVMVMGAGGLVTAEAEAVIAAMLEADPESGPARYYLGLMHAQTGRPDLAFAFWRRLLEEGPETAPWIPVIRANIGDLAAAAGVDYAPPPVRGPSAADIAAAEDMTDEDRQAMIRGMVDGLAERLATEGGPAEDWARLIRALGVLGDTDRARAIWDEARTVFADTPGLPTVQAAAEAAGLNE